MSRKPKNAYEKLRDKWYKKLKTTKSEQYPDGFKDIEHSEEMLTEYSSVYFKKHSYEEVEEKQRYHDMAVSFLEQYKFTSDRDKVIWEYHTNGISARDITKLFKKVKIQTNKTTVNQVINRLKIKMFDMLWAPLKEYHEGTDE